MTISRSPLKDSDFQNYAKYLLAKGDAQFESESSNAVTYGGGPNYYHILGVTTDCRTALLNALVRSDYHLEAIQLNGLRFHVELSGS